MKTLSWCRSNYLLSALERYYVETLRIFFIFLEVLRNLGILFVNNLDTDVDLDISHKTNFIFFLITVNSHSIVIEIVEHSNCSRCSR